MNQKRFEEAYSYAEKKHKGQYRRGGKEYITHPLAVAQILKNKGYGEEYILAGLFHDLLEDTDASEEEILRLSSPAVLHAVKLVTKEENYSQEDYIRRIKNDSIAFAVKSADRLHNLLCASEAEESFRKRYIKDTAEWYLGFSEDIVSALKELAKTLSSPMDEYPFLYE